MWTCSQPERLMHLISAIFPSALVFPHRLPKGIPSVWAACDFCQRPILVSLVCFFFFPPLKGSICGHIPTLGASPFFKKIRQSRQRGRSVSATDGRQIWKAAPASRFASFRQTKGVVPSSGSSSAPSARQRDVSLLLVFFFF